MVPVGIAMAATLAFGNAVYLHLGVALIQMLKAFTPVIVMIGLVLANIERPTWQVVACVAGISVGTAVNCSGTMDYSGFGLLLMFGSETFEAVRLVLTQKLLQNEKFVRRNMHTHIYLYIYTYLSHSLSLSLSLSLTHTHSLSLSRSRSPYGIYADVHNSDDA